MLKPKAQSKPLVITDATKNEVERLSASERAMSYRTKTGQCSPWFYTEENPFWFTTSFKSKMRIN